ncbi:hypothetical protein VP01_590g3 [Puccinia sorghi]|uniref:Rhodanese domain-containing protein n=1 Tax=Puccinia sorghi TaxID=27349 RepID=A0A0L6UII9_9BASI|nr:hypothetical protein VP01_590g3 [Puccinia sorghi]
MRYGRQMIVSQVGLSGQTKLRRASVLVVGAGGLGCPALLYLARAGVGNISIVDHDTVELSNLHRQVLHSDSTLGLNKAESARINLLAGNPSVNITAYPIPFLKSRMAGSPVDGLPDMRDFAVVLDCTDNPASRYLLSDVCAAYKIPLVSGAAIRAEGQLSVWNLPSPDHDSPHDGQRGPCYRCIFPESHLIRAERCADHGVLGPAVGVVGVLMAWEAIRLLIGNHDLKPKLLLVPSFRTIKLRKAKKDCLGCSNKSTSAFLEGIKMQTSGDTMEGEDSAEEARLLNACPMHSLQMSHTSAQRISAQDILANKYHLNQFRLLDVRPHIQFEICALPNSINIPIDEVLDNPAGVIERLGQTTTTVAAAGRGMTADWLVVCRRGNDSLLAAETLNHFISADFSHHPLPTPHAFRDLVGGLDAYSRLLDPAFPLY